MGKLATSPLPYRGAPPLQSGGQNQKWPTSGQIGYLTPAVSGSPTAVERGAKSEAWPRKKNQKGRHNVNMPDQAPGSGSLVHRRSCSIGN